MRGHVIVGSVESASESRTDDDERNIEDGFMEMEIEPDRGSVTDGFNACLYLHGPMFICHHGDYAQKYTQLNRRDHPEITRIPT